MRHASGGCSPSSGAIGSTMSSPRKYLDLKRRALMAEGLTPEAGALRTRELGIRMAIGARRGDAVALIVQVAITPVAIGAIA
jgi:hypothetical protein